MEDSRNIIKAIDALTLKVGGEAVDSKNITEAIDRFTVVCDSLTYKIDELKNNIFRETLPANSDLNDCMSNGQYLLNGIYTYVNAPAEYGILEVIQIGADRTSVLFQRVTTMGAIYIRYRAENVWRNWYKYTGTILS